jgi:hypothetical protein
VRNYGITEAELTETKATTKPTGAALALSAIGSRILIIRGHRVMIDADLAEMYDVPTKALNQAVKRNADRFPDDFAFRLTPGEKMELVTNCDRFERLKHSSALPLAFLEHGAVMAASVLNSARAIEVSIVVVRAFVALRRAVASHSVMSRRLDELERKHAVHDDRFKVVFEAIRELMEPPKKARRKIGF